MKQYVVDAFADRVFGGNPAAVCVLDKPISDDLMQKIAIENNLSETAFAVREGEWYRLRWFTPGGEINLCGHATLAAGYALFRFFHPDWPRIVFHTTVGRLRASHSRLAFSVRVLYSSVPPFAIQEMIPIS